MYIINSRASSLMKPCFAAQGRFVQVSGFQAMVCTQSKTCGDHEMCSHVGGLAPKPHNSNRVPGLPKVL